MSTRYRIVKNSGSFSRKNTPGTSKSKAFKARSELLANLKTIQPALANEIENSDAINHDQLNRRETLLSRELQFLNRDCDRLLTEYHMVLPSSRDPSSNLADNLADFQTRIDELLAKGLKRREEIALELAKIKEQREAPMLARLN